MMNLDTTRLNAVRPPKHYNNLKVTDLDPLSTGTIPRLVEVQSPNADGAKLYAMWHGTPSLAINDYVRCRQDTTDTEVLIIEGAGGATSGQTDHGSASGLTDDDHTQYALLAGRSGGQELKGGTGSGEDLTLTSTNHATKGQVTLGNNTLVVDEATGNIGFNTTDIEAWHSSIKALEALDTSIMFGNDTDYHLISNAYYDGTWKYKTTDLCANSYLYKGEIMYRTAVSGTIDTAVPWTEVMRITNAGNVGIGSATGPTGGNGRVLFFGDNASDPTMGANTSGVYGKDVSGTVEIFAIDEAGNATQLTSHNFTLFTPDGSFELPFSFYSKNPFIGKEINVDIFGAIRALETLTGQTFIHLRDLPPEEILDWDTVEEAKRLQREQERADHEADPKQTGPAPEPYIKKPLPSWMAGRMPVTKQKKPPR